jgi:hypothetical protein
VSCSWSGACSACDPLLDGQGLCTDTCLPVAGDRCTDALVEANRISKAIDGDCIVARAVDAGLRLERNRGSRCPDIGVDRRRRRPRGAERDRPRGRSRPAHPRRRACARRERPRACSGDGFFVETAFSVTLDGDQAIANADDGFDLNLNDFSVSIAGAVAKGNARGGIEIGATSSQTDVSESRASGNELDFCDEGLETTSTGNRFGTTGATCTPD